MTRTLEWSHQATWSAEPASAAHARRFACDALEWHGQEDLVDAVRLVVSELATNAVLHARTAFTVTLAWDGAVVTVRVRDGSDVPPAVLRAPGQDGEDRGPVAPRGRGLYMVDAYSDGWGSDREPEGGKTVWAVFRAPSAEDLAAAQGLGSRPTARRLSKFEAAHSVSARVPLVE